MECESPKYLVERDVTVPCSKCAFCLATRRSDWVSRLIQEWKHSSASSFVTLTYANAHLTFLKGTAQLVKADLQKWFKRVRKAGYKFRYYAVGEYGSQTYRPHYHVLLFGTVPEHVIRKTWDKGTVHIGRVTYSSCGYCTKYVINSKVSLMKHNREPPFATMSRRPGIGASYLTQAMIAWHKEDRRNYIVTEGQKRHLPKYYKDKIFTKRDRYFISSKAQRESLDSLREELKQLSRHHKNAQEYREQMRANLSKRIRDKAKQSLTI